MDSARCPAHGDLADGRCAWCGEWLPARRRRFCSEACQRTYGANHYWSQARSWALQLAEHRCERCPESEQLEVHHRRPVGRRGYGVGCQHHQENLAVLCPTHHREAHELLKADERPGTVTQLRLVAA